MNSGDGEEARQLHIAVLPWLAFGHMIPFLELSKSLAKRGHRISFLATPKNIARLPKLLAGDEDLITFVPLPLPRVDGLSDGAESTSDVAAKDVQYLKLAHDALDKPFADFLNSCSSSSSSRLLDVESDSSSSQKPDWVVLDFAAHWAPAIAAEQGVPCAFFSVYNASFLAFIGPPEEMVGAGAGGRRSEPEDFTSPPEWITIEYSSSGGRLACSLHGGRHFAGFYDVNASGIDDMGRLRATVLGCRVVAPRSCVEVEGDYLRLLGELYAPAGTAVVPAGLLPPPEVVSGGGGESSEIMEWMEKQSRGSVVYVAFGSEATLSVPMLQELALGLELSGLPFIWALKKPKDLPESEKVLPEGFETRTSGRGLVVTSWVPQLDVLAHPSLGCFLSHSGWSSVIEAMKYGRPLVLLPITGDQELHAHVVVGKGFGVVLPRSDEDGTFDREAVAKAVRLAVANDEGESLRIKAKEMRDVFADAEVHEGYIDRLAAYLRDHRHRHRPLVFAEINRRR